MYVFFCTKVPVSITWCFENCNKIAQAKREKQLTVLYRCNYLITAKRNHKPPKASSIGFHSVSWGQIGHLRCVDHRDSHRESHNDKEKLNQNDYQVNEHSEKSQLERANCFIDLQNTRES